MAAVSAAYDRSGDKSKLALLPDREYTDLVSRHDEPIKRDAAGVPVRDHQFPYLAVDAAAYQGVSGKLPDGARYRRKHIRRRSRILSAQDRKGALDVRRNLR